jgi:hypothetical protein
VTRPNTVLPEFLDRFADRHDNAAHRGYGEVMRAGVLLPFVLSLTCAVAAIPCRGTVESTPEQSGFPEQTITADYGPSPLIPARNDSGGSTAPAMSTWATPGSPTELFPLVVEMAPFILRRDIMCAGYSPGVERPPKISL